MNDIKQARGRRFWRSLGPGIITGASDDDPSGIATYSQAGATFGLALLWTALFTYPMLYALQLMCGRMSVCCGTGLSGIIKRHYSKSIAVCTALLLFPALVVNIAADIAGMIAVVKLLWPSVPSWLVNFLICIINVLFLTFFKYKTIASVLKYFCLFLFCYFIVPFLVAQNWKEVMSATFFPKIVWSPEYLKLVVAVFGTTISPYLFFWQSFISLEHKQHNHQQIPREMEDQKLEINVGMFMSNLAMYFIILTTASVLFSNGVTQITTIAEAAEALKPLAGNSTYLLFSLGILGLGFLSIPVLAASIGYVVAEAFDWKKGLDCKASEAKNFYLFILSALVLGFLINLFNIDAVDSLIAAAVLYGLICPFFIALILHICNNKAILGEYTNGPLLNIIGFVTLIVMTAASIALLWQIFSGMKE